jgi:hypothetical protein
LPPIAKKQQCSTQPSTSWTQPNMSSSSENDPPRSNGTAHPFILCQSSCVFICPAAYFGVQLSGPGLVVGFSF